MEPALGGGATSPLSCVSCISWSGFVRAWTTKHTKHTKKSKSTAHGAVAQGENENSNPNSSRCFADPDRVDRAAFVHSRNGLDICRDRCTCTRSRIVRVLFADKETPAQSGRRDSIPRSCRTHRRVYR